jgi:NAD(P)-dependent dehydrogenase (short-subunit alcohol dehydrogenase family)
VGRDLARCAVVITGASSGIGRAAAPAFARRGSGLVLAARARSPLEEIGRECEAVGTEAIWLQTDVRDEGQVADLARCAVDRFGRVDVWVNSAGVIAYGRFEDMPANVFRAVLETNLFGHVHAARAALPHFRRQRSGVLINMASVWGRVTAPDVSAYVTSKFAVRAFGECLRHELRDLPEIDVVTVLPQAVDTPIFRRAGNFAGRAARPIPPLVDPDTVARGIVRCAESPKPEVTYSRTGRALEFVHAAAPALYSRFLPPVFEAGNYADHPLAPTTGTVLDASAGPYSREGGWKRHRRRELVCAFTAAARGLAQGARRRGMRRS